MISSTKKSSRYFTFIEPVLKTPIVKTYGSLIFTIVAMIVFILFAIKPTIETIVLLQKDLENKKETLTKLNQKIDDLNAGRANLEQIDTPTKQKVESLVPKLPDLPGLIRTLEQSVSSPASISAIQFQPLIIEKPSLTAIESQLVEVKFTFNAEGSYDSLKNILQNLNSGSRLISITDLVFNKNDNSLIMSVTGKAYYLK